jgi:hypothetical protein
MKIIGEKFPVNPTCEQRVNIVNIIPANNVTRLLKDCTVCDKIIGKKFQ